MEICWGKEQHVVTRWMKGGCVYARREKYIFNLRRQQISAKMSRQTILFCITFFPSSFFTLLFSWYSNIEELFLMRRIGYNVETRTARRFFRKHNNNKQWNLATFSFHSFFFLHRTTATITSEITKSPHMDLFLLLIRQEPKNHWNDKSLTKKKTATRCMVKEAHVLLIRRGRETWKLGETRH